MYWLLFSDIDECSNNPCQNGALCANLHNQRICSEYLSIGVCNIPCTMSLIQPILLTVTCDSLHQYSLIVRHNQRPFSSYIKLVYSTVIDGVLTYYPLQKWNFQTSTSVHRHHAKMEVHALISLEASAVIARRSSREQTAKTQQVLITFINKHNP